MALGGLLIARVRLERLVALVLVLHRDLAHRVDPRKLEVQPRLRHGDRLTEAQHDGALALVDRVPRSEQDVGGDEADEQR